MNSMNHTSISVRSLSKLITYAGSAALALVLSGCVTLQAVVPAAETPRATVGYVAGVFSMESVDDYALGLTNLNGGEELVLPFADTNIPKKRGSMAERVTMIQVPAGRYRISSWLTFSRLGNELIRRKAMPKEEESLQFDVSPGRVRYLGKFAANTSREVFSVYFKIDPQRISQSDLARLLEQGYPSFSTNLIDAQPGAIY
jgi:hypothetical protein